MSTATRIEVADVEGVQVARLRDKQILDERTVREVADQLFALVPTDGTPLRLVVDFTGVEFVSSTFLGKLIVLRRKADATGGVLRLCEVSPALMAVFKSASLDRLFSIARDRREALEAF